MDKGGKVAEIPCTFIFPYSSSLLLVQLSSCLSLTLKSPSGSTPHIMEVCRSFDHIKKIWRAHTARQSQPTHTGHFVIKQYSWFEKILFSQRVTLPQKKKKLINVISICFLYQNLCHADTMAETLWTANVYTALQGLYRFSLLWGNPVIFTDCREILQLSWGLPSICKYYRVDPHHE